MPRSPPAAASRKASLTVCGVAGFSSSATRSTTETLAVGTRMAMPSSLPLSLGSTRPTAVAAPVVVGIMLTAPARARRRSLCGKSWIGWSLVYECTVVMKPRLMPNLSSRTLAVVASQLVVHRVVLEQMGQGLRVREVVDADHLDITTGLERGAEEHASDAAEAVDADSNTHGRAPCGANITGSLRSGQIIRPLTIHGQL